MSTYYEMLQIAPTATMTEIEAAYEMQYNQWRRLVTHHDPKIVNQANQTLQMLEQIRATLTDPVQRATYDAQIGLGGAAGGLADPTAIHQGVVSSPMTPPAPPPPLSSPSTAAAVAQPNPSAPVQAGLWACYKCGTENPTNTKFCLKCGAQLVRKCPECNCDSSLVATGMCGTCGTSYELATRRKELQKEIAKVQQEINTTGGSGSSTIGCGAVIIVAIVLSALLGFMVEFLPALVVGLIIGGVLIFVGKRANSRDQAKLFSLNGQIERLQKKKRELDDELKGVQHDPFAKKPVREGAHIVNVGRGYQCSECHGYVRSDAESCKHCKRAFT
jgi:YD repeat-containing protein